MAADKPDRGVTVGWAGWAIAHPIFGKIVMRWQERRRTALLLAHPVLGSQLRPCSMQVQNSNHLKQGNLINYLSLKLNCQLSTLGRGKRDLQVFLANFNAKLTRKFLTRNYLASSFSIKLTFENLTVLYFIFHIYLLLENLSHPSSSYPYPYLLPRLQQPEQIHL